jgi:hypothetical protein
MRSYQNDTSYHGRERTPLPAVADDAISNDHTRLTVELTETDVPFVLDHWHPTPFPQLNDTPNRSRRALTLYTNGNEQLMCDYLCRGIA